MGGGERNELFQREWSLELLHLSARNKISFVQEEQVVACRMCRLNDFVDLNDLFVDAGNALDVKRYEGNTLVTWWLLSEVWATQVHGECNLAQI